MTQNGWRGKRLIDREFVAAAIGTAATLDQMQQLAARCAAEGISLQALCDTINTELADAANDLGADLDPMLAVLSALAQSSAIGAYSQKAHGRSESWSDWSCRRALRDESRY